MQHEIPYSEGGRLINTKDVRRVHPDDRDIDYKNPENQWQFNGFIDLADPNLTKEEKVEAKRIQEEQLAQFMPPVVVPDDMIQERITVPGCVEEPETESWLIMRKPKAEAKGLRPCIFYIMGGGTVSVYPEQAPTFDMARFYDAVTVSPAYRDSVAAEYPAAINDLHAAYQWVLDNAGELGVDPAKILVIGPSTGAHLALSITFRLKRYGIKPCGVVSLSPICDERGLYPSSRTWYDCWDGVALQQCYRQYLGNNFANPLVGPEAMPGRATVEECKGFPALFLNTQELDPDRDAAAHLALTMWEAGVFCDFHVWAGINHNGQIVNHDPDVQQPEFDELFSGLVRKFIADCFKYDMSRDWLYE